MSMKFSVSEQIAKARDSGKVLMYCNVFLLFEKSTSVGGMSGKARHVEKSFRRNRGKGEKSLLYHIGISIFFSLVSLLGVMRLTFLCADYCDP